MLSAKPINDYANITQLPTMAELGNSDILLDPDEGKEVQFLSFQHLKNGLLAISRNIYNDYISIKRPPSLAFRPDTSSEYFNRALQSIVKVNYGVTLPLHPTKLYNDDNGTYLNCLAEGSWLPFVTADDWSLIGQDLKRWETVIGDYPHRIYTIASCQHEPVNVSHYSVFSIANPFKVLSEHKKQDTMGNPATKVPSNPHGRLIFGDELIRKLTEV